MSPPTAGLDPAAAVSDPRPVPGAIALRGARRAFAIRADHGGTLKELLLRRRPRTGGGGSPEAVRALDGVDLDVAPGETVALVGRNGAGKSSTLRILAGIVPLDDGVAAVGGRVVTLLELGAGFDRNFTGRENVLLVGALHGMRRGEITARMDAIVAFSELGRFVDAPVKTYSSGMFVRLGFAIAAHLDADLLLIDEVLAVGDAAFREKCERRIAQRVGEGATLVLVTHDLDLARRTCARTIVLDRGRIVHDGPTAASLAAYERRVAEGDGAPVRGDDAPGTDERDPRDAGPVDLAGADAAGRTGTGVACTEDRGDGRVG